MSSTIQSQLADKVFEIFHWISQRQRFGTEVIEKIRAFKGFIQMGFSKPIIEIIRIEKKRAIIGDKISKLRLAGLGFEKPPPESICNMAIFSIMAFVIK